MEGPEKYNTLIKDKILFEPYMNDGYQAKIKIPYKKGIISVRYKGTNLMADKDHPFEVWYPGDDIPTGYQTARDIFSFINPNIKFEDII